MLEPVAAEEAVAHTPVGDMGLPVPEAVVRVPGMAVGMQVLDMAVV